MTPDNAVYLCRVCGLEFLSPQLDDKTLKKLYSATYYEAWGLTETAEDKDLKAMKTATFNLRLELVKKFQPSGAILDIGCATGYLLEAAQQKKYEPFGVEYSEFSSAIAARKFGKDRIFNGELEKSNFLKDFFNVICMFDLIEHLRNPAANLNYAAGLLKTNGVIILSTPDTGSFSHKIMGKKWAHYKPEHFFYFNKKSLERMATKCGLKIVHSEKSKKALNLNYLYTQFKIYKHWFFTPFISILNALAPPGIRSRNFYISIGELTVILQKES